MEKLPEDDQIKDYLLTHPLAFEIISILLEEGQVTSSDIGKKLERGLSTVYVVLDDMKNFGILTSEKGSEDRRKTYFSIINPESVQSYFYDDEIVRAFAESSTMLRYAPSFLMNLFKEKLVNLLSKDFDVIVDRAVDALSGPVVFDFYVTGPSGTYFVEIKRVLNYSVDIMYQIIGKLYNYVKGIDDNILFILLLPEKRNFDYEETLMKFLNKFNSEQIRVKLVKENISNVDVVNPILIQGIANDISNILTSIEVDLKIPDNIMRTG